MKKALLAIIVLILAIPLYLFASGKIGISSVSMILNVMTGSGIESPDDHKLKSRLQLPEGFSISMYAADVPNARFIQMTTNNDLLISRPHRGEVMLIAADQLHTGRSGERSTLPRSTLTAHQDLPFIKDGYTSVNLMPLAVFDLIKIPETFKVITRESLRD